MQATLAIHILAGVLSLLTAYLVVTSLTTILPPRSGSRALQVCALLVALGVGISNLGFGFEAVANGGSRQGMPAFPFFLFGTIALLAGMGDLRTLRSGAPQGAARIARHLRRVRIRRTWTPVGG